MALYYDSLDRDSSTVRLGFDAEMRSEARQSSLSLALRESAGVGSIAGLLVSTYWIATNDSAVIPTVLVFAALFALAATMMRGAAYLRTGE